MRIVRESHHHIIFLHQCNNSGSVSIVWLHKYDIAMQTRSYITNTSLMWEHHATHLWLPKYEHATLEAKSGNQSCENIVMPSVFIK